MRPTRVTMQDVARAAQVSQTTVSFVLNDRAEASIPQETRDRIWQAVTTLGYRPNAMARALRQGTSSLIGFVTDEIATTPFAGQIVRGAQDVAWQHRRILMMINTDHQSDLEQEALGALLQHQVDAIILATMAHKEIAVPALLDGFPVVLVNAYSALDDVPAVVPDERRGGFEATAHLLAHGHRRIGVIDNLDDSVAATLRIQGWRDAHVQAGLAADPALLVKIHGWQEAGFEGAMDLLQRPDRPTALFCLNDRAAMGAFEAARALGLRIPEDVSIVGFDNQEVIAAHLRPTLTTMQLPHHEMGRRGMLALLGVEPLPRGRTLLHCPLVARASVGRCAAP
ncbi:LacI family DNA-binding transcriptional regulator [uncultured Sphaerotilus sp.]|uniref:LacI family DNA-binding transcriptional regulator n=1 Tax=uncultured Sphaerotilus sp. TaxID=474984 RepID=UPI0030CA3C1B